MNRVSRLGIQSPERPQQPLPSCEPSPGHPPSSRPSPRVFLPTWSSRAPAKELSLVPIRMRTEVWGVLTFLGRKGVMGLFGRKSASWGK